MMWKPLIVAFASAAVIAIPQQGLAQLRPAAAIAAARAASGGPAAVLPANQPAGAKASAVVHAHQFSNAHPVQGGVMQDSAVVPANGTQPAYPYPPAPQPGYPPQQGFPAAPANYTQPAYPYPPSPQQGFPAAPASNVQPGYPYPPATQPNPPVAPVNYMQQDPALAGGYPSLLAPQYSDVAAPVYDGGLFNGSTYDGATYDGSTYGGDAFGEGPPAEFGPCGCGCCSQCLSHRIWGSVEYLVWWRKGSDGHVPPLVTTSLPGTPQAQAGVLGAPNTSILFGGGPCADIGASSGGRATLGYWLDCDQREGIVVRYFGLENVGSGFSQTASGGTILARPFFDAFLNQPNSLLVSFPGAVNGSVTANIVTKVQGGDAFWRHALNCDNRMHRVLMAPARLIADLFRPQVYRVDFISGYQYSRLDDNLSVQHNLVSVGNGGFTAIGGGGLIPVGTTIVGFDRFKAENEFHGGTFGIMAEYYKNKLTLNLLGKVGLGYMRHRVSANGSTTVTTPNGLSSTMPGALLTQPTNIGSTGNFHDFAVVPEAQFTLKYRLAKNIDVSLGYSFIFWSSFVRAPEAVDTSVNLHQTPTLVGPAQPLLITPKPGTYWVQGLNTGLSFRY